MNCAEFEQLVDAYLDGELSGSLRLEFDAHRLRCRRCQLTLATAETVGDVVASEPDAPELSFDFTDRVMAQVKQQAPARTLRLPSRRVAIVGGALLQAAAVLLLAVYLPLRGQDVQSTAPADRGEAVAVVSAADESAGTDEYFAEADAREAAHQYVVDRIFSRLEEYGGNVLQDIRSVSEYGLALSIPDDLARASAEFGDRSPALLMFEALAPRAPERERPPAQGPDQYSL
jgi:hypothetical protein